MFDKIKELSRRAREHFGAGRHREASELHAEARAAAEAHDPSLTVAQLNDGRLAVIEKKAYEGSDPSAVHAELTNQLDDAEARDAAPTVQAADGEASGSGK